MSLLISSLNHMGIDKWQQSLDFLRQSILDWFPEHGRHDLPWQQQITPYRVWISEIMLQQTQVETVKPFFEKFMAAFPDLKTLATSPIDRVLSLWRGLGYYGRARRLHAAAVLLHEQGMTDLPNHLEGLMTLPGIGRSTAGAILALGFNQPGIILDGNVKRVLARYCGILEPLEDREVLKQLWVLSDILFKTDQPRALGQAMMDLGATWCKRIQPRCTDCPARLACQALAQNTVLSIPQKTIKKSKPIRYTHFHLYYTQHSVFLYQRASEGLWGGLWSLPEEPCVTASEFRHTFTHFHLHFDVSLHAKNKETRLSMAGRWIPWSEALQLGLPQPLWRILTQLHHTEFSKEDHDA